LKRTHGTAVRDNGRGSALPGWARLPAGDAPWVLGLVVGAVLLPLLVQSDQWRQILVLIVIYAGLASGLNLLVGYAGLLDLGFIAFYAVGAYFTSLISVRVLIDAVGPERYASDFWWLPYVSMVPAAIVAGCVAAVLGYPTLRARGDYLAIMTLGLGEIVRLIAINWTGLTQGPPGIRAIPPFAVGDTLFLTPLENYYVSLALVGIALLLLWRLRYGHLARVWRVIREDELSAESVGIHAPRYKLMAYVGGGLVAGWVGVVFAHSQGFVSPDSFALDLNFVILALVIIGGRGTWLGPIVGAALWVSFDQYVGQTGFFQQHPELRDAILGAVVLAVLYVAPEGVVRLGQPLRRAASAISLHVLAEADARPGKPRGQAGDAYDSAGKQSVATHSTESPLRVAAGGAASRPATLAAVRLACRFGGLTAVDGVSFALAEGEILGVMGPNGAGKTTLLNMLSGVQQPSSGSIEIGGVEARLRRPSEAAAAGVARTFQTSRIIQELSVMENVLIGAHRSVGRGPGVMLGIGAGRHMHEHRGRARAVLELVELLQVADDSAAGLPYVSQRRLEIARALMTDPRFVLLDEPAAGMTPREGSELGALLERLRSWGLGVMLIEHDMRLLMQVSDRVIALDHGEIVTIGPPERVRRNPVVIQAYLGPLAVPPGVAEPS
jgi:branched-chain amino acid transport system permease protein